MVVVRGKCDLSDGCCGINERWKAISVYFLPLLFLFLPLSIFFFGNRSFFFLVFVFFSLSIFFGLRATSLPCSLLEIFNKYTQIKSIYLYTLDISPISSYM